MSFPLKFLQRAGLASTMLIVGVLVGVMAPLPADAHPPDVKISVKVGTNAATSEVPVVFNSTLCTPPTGYTHCYQVNLSATPLFGPTGRQYRLQAATGQTARLLVADGSAFPRQMQFTGVQFVPQYTSPSSWETSTTPVAITIHVHNRFNVSPSSPTAGTPNSVTRYGMRLGQVFAAPSGTLIPTPLDNILQVWGTGIFKGSEKRNIDYPRALAAAPSSLSAADKAIVAGDPGNTNAGNSININTNTAIPIDTNSSLYEYVAAGDIPGVTTVQNSVDAFSNYPGFQCTTAPATTYIQVTPTSATAGTSVTISGTKCIPDVDVYYKITTYGVDVPVLNTSGTSSWGSCGEIGTPDCVCSDKKNAKPCLTKLLKGSFDKSKGDEDELQDGIPHAVPCGENLCNGILRNEIAVTKDVPIGTKFPFLGAGPGINNFEIVTTSSKGRIDGKLDPPFTGLRTGPGGTDRRIGPDYRNPDWPQFLEVDQFIVRDSAGNEVGEPHVTVLSCANGHKGPVIIHDQQDYTIEHHPHATQGTPQLCEEVNIE